MKTKLIILIISLIMGCGNLLAQEKSQTKEMNVSTYPNPTSEGFYVNIGETNAIVIIYNVSGELLITKSISGKEYIPVDGLRKGTYFVKISTNQGSITKKLIVK